MSKLFVYAVIYCPKPKKVDGVELPGEIIVEPTNIMARDEQEVAIRAARAIPEEYLNKLSDVEVLVRPF